MFKPSEDELEFQKLLNTEEGEKLKQTFKIKQEEQLKILELFMLAVNHCTFNKFSDDKIIWNAAGAVNLISLDLKYLIYEMMFTESEWGKRVHARTICMLIYESLNDLFELLGKDFKPILGKLSSADELETELRNIRQSLNEYKSAHFEVLRDIRNVATAHRDKDIMAQINAIAALSWMNVFNYGNNFDIILNRLGAFFQKVITISIEEFKR